VGACKPADKGQGALKSEGVAALNLSKSEASVFAKYFEQEDCAVDELEALGALAGLGLGERGTNNLEFASRTFNNGQVAYRDMVVTTEDAKTFSAKEAVFHCPSMGDEAPQFARLDLTDVTAQDDKGASFTFGTLNIAKPTTQAAAALVNGMLDPNAAGNQTAPCQPIAPLVLCLEISKFLKNPMINFLSKAYVPSLQRNYEMMKTLGFDSLTLSGSSVTTLDEKDDSISLSDGLLVLEDGFALNFEYSAEGLSDMVAKAKSLSEASEDQDLIAIYDSLNLRDFRLTLEDNSIVERGLKLASEMTGQSETNIKLGLSAAVFFAASAAQNEVQAEVYSETVEAFAEFVKKGGKLTIEANPPAPFALSPLITGKGEDIDPATLGFSASHEDGK